MKIDHLSKFPAGDNPFWHDIFHMGTYMGGNGNDPDVCVMFADHQHNKYVIVVDTVTGDRVKVTFDRRPAEERNKDVGRVVHRLNNHVEDVTILLTREGAEAFIQVERENYGYQRYPGQLFFLTTDQLGLVRERS